MRGYISKKFKITLPDKNEDYVKYLSVKYSYDSWIVKLWIEVYGEKTAESLLAAGNESTDMTIRCNWLKIMRPH